MKIFLDDIRDAPDDTWTVIRNPLDFGDLVHSDKWNDVEVVSLDHDLGFFMSRPGLKLGNEITGYHVLCSLELRAFEGKLTHVPEFRIHSANPVGRANMERAINSIQRIMGNGCE